MSIKDFKFPTHTEETAGGKITVRGLNTVDIQNIVRRFDEDIIEIAIMQAGKLDPTTIMTRLVSEVPNLAACIISHGADEPGAETEAAIIKFPFGVQFSLLEKIMELTFAAEGGLLNFMMTVQRLLALSKDENLKQFSGTGSGDSSKA
jgi:hypothetical protein